jgi:hypothetical protein
MTVPERVAGPGDVGEWSEFPQEEEARSVARKLDRRKKRR